MRVLRFLEGMMMRIEDVRKYQNIEASDLRLLVVALEVENDSLKRQLEQAIKERNTMFERQSNIKLPDMVVNQGQQQKGGVQVLPRGVPQPLGVPRSVPPGGVQK